jgi:hypothetical protein
MIARTWGTIFDDSSNEIVYGMVARTQSAPSSSFGMNSPPRLSHVMTDATATPPHTHKTARVCARLQSRPVS